MRILTSIAGILICAAGVFCFAVYINPFADVAFLVGAVMLVAGILHSCAYLVSGKGANRLTDTALVEGLVTFFYGFAVLNNQITDTNLTLFFGTWLTLCGVTRVSQSLYVSRFNPKDWAKIMPLSIVSTILGVIMMMPSILSAVMPLMLVGGAFIVDGLSILIYAMFMRRKDAGKGASEIEARNRAEAKKALRKEKENQRDKLRSMSKMERDEANAKIAADHRKKEEAERNEKFAKRKARKEFVASQRRTTIPVSKEEAAEIIAAAPKEQLEEDAKLAAQHAKEIADNAEQNASVKPLFKIPEQIPSIKIDIPEKKSAIAETEPVKAVNLEEIEKAPDLGIEKVELPKLDFSSMNGVNMSREEILESIAGSRLPKMETVDYTPLNLEELVSEPMARPVDPEDQKRFTQMLNFESLAKINEETQND